MPVFRRTSSMALLLLFIIGLIAACEAQVPAPPIVTVNITAVNDQAALDDAVALALTSTAVQNIHLTETQLAARNITLTPSSTPTLTPTPRPPTATPILSPTPTLLPTATSTPTYAALPTNTPAAQSANDSASGNGRVRVLHAWRSANPIPVDIWIDDVPVARAMTIGSATNFQSVAAQSIRLSVQAPEEALEPGEEAPPPLLSRVIDVPPGRSVSVVIADYGQGVVMTPIMDDASPLASGSARLTLLQANPLLLRSNLLIPDMERALTYELANGQQAGPFDLPASTYSIMLYDSDNPDLIVDSIPAINLDSRVNYLAVFVPVSETADALDATDVLIFSSSTGRTRTDVPLRFINAASNAGTVSILVDDQPQIAFLDVGKTSVAVPVSTLGSTMTVFNAAGERLFTGPLGGWTGDEATTDKMVLLSDAETQDSDPNANLLNATIFSQNPRPSVVGSNIRLIHGLTGTTVTLDLQIRSTTATVISSDFGVPQSQQADTAWSPVIQNVSFGLASDYVLRTPNVFDVRLVLSGTQSVQASLTGLQLLAGGVYDFVALPGDQRGVAQLVLIEPDVQVASPGINQADPDVIREQVEAVLTASAPAITSTPTAERTPTPTISPVPTNTPRPSNTPGVTIPGLQVNPAPPEAVYGSFVLSAEGFSPDKRYTVNIDDGPENWSGSTGIDGRFSLTIVTPADLTPGLHVVRVCVDCRPGGVQQEQLIAIKVADPQVTPTATKQP